MREIKFRAWQDGQMATQPMSSNFAAGRFFGFLYEDAPIMQFTGLLDKNGKEIYESDLILWRDKVWIIAWRERAAGFGLFVPSTYEHEQGKRLLEKHFCGREKDYEIIGNIYKNPELLK